MTKKKMTLADIKSSRETGRKFAMITVYDFPMASLVDKSDIEMILVGDSLGMVIQGLDSTVPVTMREMLYHLTTVRKGAPNTFVVGDMCFMSYQACEKEAIHNAGLLMQAGADCVKIEGNRYMAPKIEAVAKAGIPVMGHIGLTPQTAANLGGFKLQGKDLDSAKLLVEDALAFEAAGAFALDIECLPAALTEVINNKVSIPTISVGAGVCPGYNLNAYDILGMFDAFVPKFVKQYAQTGQDIVKAFNAWRGEIENGQYPQPEHCFNAGAEEIKKYFNS